MSNQPTAKLLVTYDPTSGVERDFAQPALDAMNEQYANGCLKRQWLAHTFTSLHNIDGPQVRTKLEAYERFTAQAPYKLNLRWYRTRLGSNVVGYTYNYLDGADSGPSETRIYSNSRTVAYYSVKDRAAHWTHELSHQARAGGFVHWTVHQGSVPYEAGDIMLECL